MSNAAQPSVRHAASLTFNALKSQPASRIVAIAGIPGSGKTTLAKGVAQHVPGAIVVPMDGYHTLRKDLSADQMSRRGAPDTFDVEALRADLLKLKETGVGTFPEFDHAEQDPRGGAITVTADAPLILVEGLYLLMDEWALAELFDYTIFLEVDLEVALDQVAKRHLACGLAKTEQEARHRADTNDRRNAELILNSGSRRRASLCVPG